MTRKYETRWAEVLDDNKTRKQKGARKYDVPGGMVLSTATYELQGLTGKLEQYNGIATRCMHLVDASGHPNPLWHIRISKKLTLELPRQFLRELSEFDFPVKYGSPAAVGTTLTLSPISCPRPPTPPRTFRRTAGRSSCRTRKSNRIEHRTTGRTYAPPWTA